MKAVAAVLISLAAAGPAAAERIEGIAAVVGDEIVLVSEIQERAGRALAQAARTQSAFIRDQQVRDVMLAYVDRMIEERLIRQEARRLMLTVDEDEVDRSIEGLKQQNGWDDFRLGGHLAERGQTMEEYRDETRLQVLKYKVISVRLRGRMRPAEVDVRRAYRQMVRSSRSGDTFEAAQILIRIPADAGAVDMRRLQERAEAIARRAREGEDFAQLARDFSDDAATAARGGSLGTLRRGELPPTLDDELVLLELGQIAGPVRGPEGFYVLKLVSGSITGVRSFEQARRGIEGRILQESMTRQEDVFLENLRRRTFIDVRLR